MDHVGDSGNGPGPDRGRNAPGRALRDILYHPASGIGPIVDALYLKQEQTARTALAALSHALAAPAPDDSAEDAPDGSLALTLTPEAREVLRLYLYWLDWQITRAFDPLTARPAKQAELVAAFGEPAVTRLGEICRHKLLLQLLINVENPQALSLPPERFHELYRHVPPDERHSELYYYTAGWAFRHGELPVLEEAFAFFTVHADGTGSDYNWQYVNLMYQILKGSVTPRDVHELLLRMTLPQELRQFDLFILPQLEQRGLRDAQLDHDLAVTRARIAALPPHLPAHELPTKHIGPAY